MLKLPNCGLLTHPVCCPVATCVPGATSTDPELETNTTGPWLGNVANCKLARFNVSVHCRAKRLIDVWLWARRPSRITSNMNPATKLLALLNAYMRYDKHASSTCTTQDSPLKRCHTRCDWWVCEPARALHMPSIHSSMAVHRCPHILAHIFTQRSHPSSALTHVNGFPQRRLDAR